MVYDLAVTHPELFPFQFISILFALPEGYSLASY